MNSIQVQTFPPQPQAVQVQPQTLAIPNVTTTAIATPRMEQQSSEETVSVANGLLDEYELQ